jgi:hypothetical protein
MQIKEIASLNMVWGVLFLDWASLKYCVDEACGFYLTTLWLLTLYNVTASI